MLYVCMYVYGHLSWCATRPATSGCMLVTWSCHSTAGRMRWHHNIHSASHRVAIPSPRVCVCHGFVYAIITRVGENCTHERVSWRTSITASTSKRYRMFRSIDLCPKRPEFALSSCYIILFPNWCMCIYLYVHVYVYPWYQYVAVSLNDINYTVKG